MKKWLLWGCTAVLALGLSGCGQAATVIVPETTVPQYEPHITMALLENCMVDADVEAPEDAACASPGAALWEPNQEAVAAVLFPQEDAVLQEIDPESYGFSLASPTDARAELYPGSLYFLASSTAADAAGLLAQCQDDHPGHSGTPLDFLTPKDAVSLGIHTLKDIIPSLEPVLDVRQSMTRAEFQENGGFDWVDSYYLRFSFSYGGIALYGSGDEAELPSLNYNYVTPAKMQAELLITSQGVQYLNLTNIYTIVGAGQVQPRIAPRTALQLLKQTLAEQGLSDPHQITRIRLQYLPVTRDMNTTLVPYWSFWMDYQYIDEYDGKTVSVKNGKVERLNAYTGDNYRSGG